MNTTQSQALFQRAQLTIPGGVNSPVRAFKSVGGTPIFFQSANGSILKDADGNEYIDYVASWGPMILGHAYPKIIEAIKEKVTYGTSFGAPSELEIQLAELIVSMVPNIDKVRMVNSGTEACMSAIRLARGYTGRDKIIKFEGCYHGHADSFLIKAGSGASTFGIPNSPGVTKGTAADTLTAAYNNLEQVEALVKKHHREIAAIIVEPVAGNMGCVLPQPEFLQGLRKICDMENILLIFDEVMTGFRLAKGGAQELLNIKADIVTFGKIIGGGLPVGAYAAKNELMNFISPVGPVYQAGTLSGNPVAVAAGMKTLEIISRDGFFDCLGGQTSKLMAGLKQAADATGIPFSTDSVGGMFGFYFTDQVPTSFDAVTKSNIDAFKVFFHAMLDEGVYLAPSAYEAGFTSIAHDNAVLDEIITASKKAFSLLNRNS
jgi:glutamate-1-semialdehyde 2,1-aminomutase